MISDLIDAIKLYSLPTFVLGNSGFANEVKFWAERNGFLCRSKIDEKTENDFIEESISRFKNNKTKTNLFLGFGSPIIKEKVVNKFTKYDCFNFPNLIDKSVITASPFTPNTGLIICPNTIITTNVKFGKFVTINIASTIGHNAIIEDFCSIMPQVAISGHVHLGKGSYVGAGAVILETQFTEENVIVGGQALVNKSVRKGETVVGVPAKPIGAK